MDDQKVIHKSAVRTQCLSAHSGFARDEILFANVGDELLQAANESFLAEGAAHFFETGSCVPGGQPPKTRVAYGIDEIAQVEGCAMISFAFKALHRIWTRMDTPVDHAREMNAQKRKLRIGNGIDEVSHQTPAFGL